MIDLNDILDRMHPVACQPEMLDKIEQEEGWREHAYQCTEGYATIGYGTNIDAGIDKVEGSFLAMYRLSQNVDRFEQLTGLDITALPMPKAMALADMCYQLGPDGLAQFRNMIAAVKAADWLEAGRQGRDSRWYHQTPNRAERNMRILES